MIKNHRSAQNDSSPNVLIRASHLLSHVPKPIGLHLSERRLLLLVGDLLMLSLALWVALWIREPAIKAAYKKLGLPFAFQTYWWFVLWSIWIIWAVTLQCYDLKRATHAIHSALYTGTCALAACGIYLIIPYISAPLVYSRLAWFIFACSACIGVGLWRVTYALVFQQPIFLRRVLVVGIGSSGRALLETIQRLGEASGIKLVGLVDDNPSLFETTVLGYPVLGSSADLERMSFALRADEIVVAITNPGRMSTQLVDALVRCWSRGIAVVPVQLFFEDMTGTLPVEYLGQSIFTLMHQGDRVAGRLWEVARRFFDILIAIIGLAILVAFFPLIALIIRLDSRGPILYRQQRVGRWGETFWIYKFRSMVCDAEPNGAVWAADNDPRVTGVGRLMRRMRIDELPQLWNLLVGNMTLIGPRPERPEFVRQLESILPYYAIRHSIKPGLTGWAQVHYRYGNSTEDALMKLKYDLYYVKHRGPVLDVSILLQTIWTVLRMQGK